MKNKGNPYATNSPEFIKAPKTVKNPKSTVVKGNDLRVSTAKK